MTRARITRTKADAVGSSDFETDEFSAESSSPVEYCEITHGVTVYRIAFGVRDLLVGSALYTATAARRGPISPAGVGKESHLAITLPIDHTLVKRYLQLGVPPKKITCTLWRLQKRSGEIQQLWSGDITSMSCDDDGTEASFRVSSRAGEALLRVLPNTTAGRTCPLVLYGARCGAARASFKVTATVIQVNGRDVRVDMGAGKASPWAENGELVHVPSLERMTIRSQTDVGGSSTVADLSLQAPIVGLQVGHSVEVYAGCDRTIETCHSKFDRRQAFGGMPQKPTKNPFIPTGFGVEEHL